MRKEEKQIILNQYENILRTDMVHNFDMADAKKEFKSLLKNLNLQTESYEVENKIISEKNGYKIDVKDSFQMIFEDFNKYNVLVNYNIDDIENIFEDLKYEMNEEEVKCNIARISYINNKLQA